MYILMGRKGTRLDWSRFDERATKTLGYVPPRNKRLTPDELEKLGFKEAADALRVSPFGITVKRRG